MSSSWSSDWLFWLGGSAIALVALALLIWSLIGDRSRGRSRCPKCWYDMSKSAPESPLRCPECGRTQKREKRLFKTRRRWKWACVALVIGMLAAFVMVQPKVRRDGWLSIMPTTVVILGLRLPEPRWALAALSGRYDFADWQHRLIRDNCRKRYRDHKGLDRRTRIELIVTCGRSDEALAASGGDQTALLALLEQARSDPDPVVRNAYLTQLAIYELNVEDVVQALFAFLEDTDPNVRQMAVLALSIPARKSETGINKLIELLASDSQIIRYCAARAIGTAAEDRSDKARLVQVLVDAYPNEPDEEVRIRIVKAIGNARPDPDQFRPVIADALQQKSTLMLGAAFESLWDCAQVHPHAIDVAMKSVKSEDEDLREMASMYLRILDPALLEPYATELEQLRDSTDESVSEMATRQLDMIRQNANYPGS